MINSALLLQYDGTADTTLLEVLDSSRKVAVGVRCDATEFANNAGTNDVAIVVGAFERAIGRVKVSVPSKSVGTGTGGKPHG